MRLYLQFILRYFRYGKKRSFSSNAINLATIGLAIGVFSLLVTISVIKGFENVLSNKLVNVDGKIRLKTIFGSSISELDRIDSTLLRSYSKMNVTPFVRGSVVIKRNKINEGLLVEGVNFLPSYNHSVNEKRFINDDEIIIGTSLAESLKLDSSEVLILVPLDGFIGDVKNLKYYKLIFKHTFKTGMEEYDRNFAYVNINTAQKIFNMNNKVSGYIINSNTKTDDLLSYLNGNIKYPYFLETWKDRHQIIFTWIRTQTLPIVIIFSLITLVGITNVMATVSLLVNERSKEIGVLLSQGFQKYQIRNIFLIESVFIGLIGSTIGALLAIFFTFIQGKYNFIQLPEEVYFMNSLPTSFDYDLCFVIMLLSLFITMFSSFLPIKTMFDNRIPKLLEN
tara:strand:- start:891 stop:2072 length:1182 start_codon:yes stop_codon:yes gene_type:complete